jgi:hypothetical protein
MNLLLRINLSLAVIFVLGAWAASVAYRSILQSNAKREILAQAVLPRFWRVKQVLSVPRPLALTVRLCLAA